MSGLTDEYLAPTSPYKWQKELESRFEELLQEYSPNNLQPLSAAVPKSQYLWVCPKGHESKRNLASQLNYTQKCVPCNSLGKLYPTVAKEISKNEQIDPFQILPRSNKPILWFCSNCNGEYLRSPDAKISKTPDCPYCTGQKVLPGFNDAKTVYPELSAFWSSSNDAELAAIAWKNARSWEWQCPVKPDHKWSSRISEFLRHENKCPHCFTKTGRRISVGTVSEVDPMIVAKWSSENLESPEEMRWHSKTKVLLTCGSHIYSRSLEKAKKSLVCPVCRNIELQKGVNDAETTHPDLLLIWGARNALSLADYTSSSCESVWWECSEGHEYLRSVRDQCKRVICRKCFQQGRSRYETEVLSALSWVNSPVETNNRSVLDGLEIDIYFPDLKKGIEVNGEWFHSNLGGRSRVEKYGSMKNYHIHKRELALSKGVDLVFVWEFDWRDHRTSVEESLSEWMRNSQPTHSAWLSRVESSLG